MKPSALSTSILALLGPVISVQAYAEIYMTETQAAASLFPDKKMSAENLQLSPTEQSLIEEKTDQKIRSPQLKYFKATSGEIVFIDQVLGKHEFITYAVGLLPDGKVAGIEIIEYRETYGQKIREPQWRSQFVGKDKSSPLKLNDDIKNISGATLSSAHVTAGVKRLVQTFEAVKGKI